MTFGKSRFSNEFELLRFCNKLYTNVIGGASKLFKHFLVDHPEINLQIKDGQMEIFMKNLILS